MRCYILIHHFRAINQYHQNLCYNRQNKKKKFWELAMIKCHVLIYNFLSDLKIEDIEVRGREDEVDEGLLKFFVVVKLEKLDRNSTEIRFAVFLVLRVILALVVGLFQSLFRDGHHLLERLKRFQIKQLFKFCKKILIFKKKASVCV